MKPKPVSVSTDYVRNPVANLRGREAVLPPQRRFKLSNLLDRRNFMQGTKARCSVGAGLDSPLPESTGVQVYIWTYITNWTCPAVHVRKISSLIESLKLYGVLCPTKNLTPNAFKIPVQFAQPFFTGEHPGTPTLSVPPYLT